MRRNPMLPLVLLGTLCLASLDVSAQNTPPQDTLTSKPATPPITYVYGDTALISPVSLAQVRRRLSQVGTHHPPQRIAYPIIVLLPQAQGLPTPTAPPLPGYLPVTTPTLQLARDADQAADEQPAPDHPVALEAAVPRVEGALLETGLFSTTDIIFRFDHTTLLPVSESILDTVGTVLSKYPALRIEIAGHTDSIGAEAYNQQLSETRARTVRQYLLTHFSINPDRIQARGYGETQPVASNATSTGRTLNRRVEFRVLNTAETVQSR